jgi:hypothetical protein
LIATTPATDVLARGVEVTDAQRRGRNFVGDEHIARLIDRVVRLLVAPRAHLMSARERRKTPH